MSDKSKDKQENIAEKVGGDVNNNNYYNEKEEEEEEDGYEDASNVNQIEDIDIEKVDNTSDNIFHDSSISSDDNTGYHTQPKNPTEEMVREWEATHSSKKLPPRMKRLALFAASLHIAENKGITVRDLEKIGDTKDNAEKMIQDARRLGLLIPHPTIKSGKQKQYFLSNYIHLVNEASNNNNKNNVEVFPTDISLLLARELSALKYVYHDIHLETALTYKEDYELLRWSIPSLNNKQKVASFKLEPHRSCSLVVSPTGTVNISIQCTHAPYEFHTPEGLVNFFASCGQIWRILQTETGNRLTVVPSIYEWLLQRFDYNKDVSVKDRGTHHPLTAISWTSRGLLKVKYLGTIFQIYYKELPNKGEHLRVEGHFSTTEKKNVVDTVEDIVAVESDSGFASSSSDGRYRDHKPKDEKTTTRNHPFITAEEMLHNLRKNTKQDNQTA